MPISRIAFCAAAMLAASILTGCNGSKSNSAQTKLLPCCASTPTKMQATTRPVPSPQQCLITQRGTIPLIITAPHDGTVALPFEKRTKGVLVRDERLIPISLGIADRLEKKLGGRPYLVLVEVSRLWVDANRSKDTGECFADPRVEPYYDAFYNQLNAYIKECSEKWPGTGMHLDLHGQKGQPRDFYRGTANCKTMKRMIGRYGNECLVGPSSIFAQLKQRGYSVFPDFTDTQVGAETVYNGGYIVRANGGAIDSMQIEIHMRHRNGEAAEQKMMDDLAESIAVFYKQYVQPAGKDKQPAAAVQAAAK